MALWQSTINTSDQEGSLAGRLLDWYDAHHRELPWRVAPAAHRKGQRPDPYRVWLSEVMLQQTTVEAVKPYFVKFLALWPDVGALAAAETEAVMKAWAGLGYYSRARNLKRCAEIVAAEHGGCFPRDEAALRQLPGIGAYTAAAIAAIAFDIPAAVVDGNIERVVARLRAIAAPVLEAKPEIKAFVRSVTPAKRPGDFAQAMMDLGATICTPRSPACLLCPISADCTALARGEVALYPAKTVKAEKPLRLGAAFVALRKDGAVLLRKRPEKGLLGGMTEVPTTAWLDAGKGAPRHAAPFPADWRPAGSIRHVFTHFALDLAVYRADIAAEVPVGTGWWSNDIANEALPTVMRKAIEAAIPGATKRQRSREA